MQRDTSRAARTLVFAAWLTAVSVTAAHHVYWRDEVRALSFALAGDDLGAMLTGLRGEGHPAVWYVLLRLAHHAVPSPAVLSVVAVLAIAAAAALLQFASPFPLPLVVLILAGGPFLFEYAAMARNYGISVPLLFGWAALYPRWRERGVGLGALAAVLVNTNAHSVLLAAGFMGCWLLDMPWRKPALLRWAGNAAVMAAGVAVCAWTLLPPANDAALAAGGGLGRLLAAVLLPATTFGDLPVFAAARALGLTVPAGWFVPLAVAGSALLLAAALGLRRWWPGSAAALGSLLAMSVFFVLVYPGDYRHEALWLMFLVALFWMQRARGIAATRWGWACFVALLALQVPSGVAAVSDALRGGPPLSQVRALAEAVRARPALAAAILLPEPDFLLEAYPAYGSQRIFLPRAGRFGTVARFTRSEPQARSLDDLLRRAGALCTAEGAPVVIVTQADLDAAALPQTFAEGYTLSLTATPAALRALRASTEFLGRFAPSPVGEAFSAYALMPPCRIASGG